MRPADATPRVGCCGFPLARRRYFETFRLVEVQQTFYQPPRLETLARWREAAPAGFEITLKAWQLITHEPSSPTYRRLKQPIPEAKRGRYGSFRPTKEVMDAWRATLAAAEALDATAIVFQCPASFTPTTEHIANLRRFFESVGGDAHPRLLAWEPRGEWPRDAVEGRVPPGHPLPVQQHFHGRGCAAIHSPPGVAACGLRGAPPRGSSCRRRCSCRAARRCRTTGTPG
jgi:uncharacterized protein YecE (DUF72 family)